ncbi:MAG: bifunctional tetrahydrofolate synthase/dihydrofolate synthase [Gammaproteobacteria bacterium]
MNLAEWLSWQETQHAKPIDLGLERTRPLLRRLSLDHPSHAIITVAGTNGKGSSVALLEAILHGAGYRVGAYTSPHLLRYNERIRILGEEADDAQLCASFERINEARGDISLTYFEFATLAAFDIFQRARLDVAILEVGLGGRLDTVNLLDADVALISAIGIDHVEWLGADRESIGREKAGIFRAESPAVCGDGDPPRSIMAHAEAVGAPLYCAGRDFGYQTQADTWSWWGQTRNGSVQYKALPYPNLRGVFQLRNAAAVLMALVQLAERCPISHADICRGLSTVNLPGRFQVIPGAITRIFDVAHNPHGAEVLAEALREHPCQGRTLAVFGMLADKDSVGVLRAMQGVVDSWYMAGLPVARAATGEFLAGQLLAIQQDAAVMVYPTISAAYAQALSEARPQDRVVMFGSFYTVAEALQQSL